MGYGDKILKGRLARGWTQRQLGEKLGCSDSYVAHLESEVKVPSVDICMALVQVFQFTPQEQQEFFEEIEEARRLRSEERIRTRGSAVRGALQRQAIATMSRVSALTEIDAASVAHDLSADPNLKDAYSDLKTIFEDPRGREVVMNVLRALAQQYKPPETETSQ